MSRRVLRLLATLVVTGLCTAYLVWKIDVTRTLHILAHANLWYFLGAVTIMVVSVWPMAWRWQRLLHARGIPDRLPWLVRAYFVSYTAGQILPTAGGGGRGLEFRTAPAPDTAAPPPDLARAPAPRCLRGDPLLPRASGALGGRLLAHCRHPGGAGAGDLVRREGGRRRPLAAAVLRHGAAPLPRPARPVLGERDRRARVVLRQLPGQSRRRRGQGVRDRLPLLRRHALPLAPRWHVARLAERPRVLAPKPAPWLTS